MKSPTKRQPEAVFLLNSLLIALLTAVSVRYDVLDDPEFGFLLILIWPITLIALLSVLATSVNAIILTIRTSDKKPILIILSCLTLAYLVFVIGSTVFGFASTFIVVTVSFIYAAVTAMNVTLSYGVTNKKIQMVFMVASLLTALTGAILWDEQQGRFHFHFHFNIGPKSQALLLAAYEGDTTQVQQLLAEDANINALDEAGLDALHIAVRRNHVETAHTLLEQGANPNTRENKSGHGSVKVDSDYTFRDSLSGNPVIVTAAQNGNEKLVQLLIDHGAAVNATNKFCDSALDMAVLHKNATMIQLLLNAGADPDHKAKQLCR
ncbi:ankyrin repeat domain-containing protein [Methylovulum miyakonense]|uniref:ankyrin repeat domain-containing protein n=1 Tax=Methylovulum miyakonense TaxID=645578 RepID=UPI00035E07F6|nr:ankyrin repeat domain-containing protein [Methylovulum miyakonense]